MGTAAIVLARAMITAFLLFMKLSSAFGNEAWREAPDGRIAGSVE